MDVDGNEMEGANHGEKTKAWDERCTTTAPIQTERVYLRLLKLKCRVKRTRLQDEDAFRSLCICPTAFVPFPCIDFCLLHMYIRRHASIFWLSLICPSLLVRSYLQTHREQKREKELVLLK